MAQGPKQQQEKGDILRTFMLGTKELDDKVAQFSYDKGWYIIADVVGEEKQEIYKSRNAQEAYTKWNVYIGRKKERAPRGAASKTEEGKTQQVQQTPPPREPKPKQKPQNSNQEVLAAERREQSAEGQPSAKRRRHRNHNRNRQGNQGRNGGSES